MSLHTLILLAAGEYQQSVGTTYITIEIFHESKYISAVMKLNLSSIDSGRDACATEEVITSWSRTQTRAPGLNMYLIGAREEGRSVVPAYSALSADPPDGQRDSLGPRVATS
jgi:hypothetical protein